MRSVLNEGTGAGARAAGFSRDAAGKSGTTNDLRDAWFIGFTPELLTVVWVGLDDNQPVGLSGTQAALPIWTTFMKRALSGQAERRLPYARGDLIRRDRSRHRKTRHSALPAHLQGSVHPGYRAGECLPAPHFPSIIRGCSTRPGARSCALACVVRFVERVPQIPPAAENKPAPAAEAAAR